MKIELKEPTDVNKIQFGNLTAGDIFSLGENFFMKIPLMKFHLGGSELGNAIQLNAAGNVVRFGQAETVRKESKVTLVVDRT